MGYSEDYIYEIFEVLEKKDLKDSFHNQLNKMKWQDKHKYKTPKEKYEYAFKKVTKQYTTYTTP
jgi:hypothetical protein